MSEIKRFTRGSLNPFDGLAAAEYKYKYLRDNPTYFDPDGIWVFCGPQGSGKTLSAIQTAREIKDWYPRVRVISNIEFSFMDGSHPEKFTSYDQIVKEDNGIEGIMFVLDEIHVLWNSLESKNIPISEMSSLCQMRKSRRLILGTSQVYSRIAKPIREQLRYVILCKNHLKVLQENVVGDPAYSSEMQGHIFPDVICVRWFFHTPELYKAYETFDKVQRVERTAQQRMGVYRG